MWVLLFKILFFVFCFFVLLSLARFELSTLTIFMTSKLFLSLIFKLQQILFGIFVVWKFKYGTWFFWLFCPKKHFIISVDEVSTVTKPQLNKKIDSSFIGNILLG